MDIRNYITFNTIVETGSFTKAAKKLNYAQPTVTLHIKELEAHYNHKLFDRLGKSMCLTLFGKDLMPHSKALTDLYERTLNYGAESKETLRIGVYESLLKYRLADLIQTYKREHPNVELVIIHGTCSSLRKKIREGLIDVMFQIEPERVFKDLNVTTLCEERFKLILPLGYELEDMYHEHKTVYLTERGCTYRLLFERYLDEKGIQIYQTMETGSIDLIKQHVGFGLGYSMIPSATLKDENMAIKDIELETTLYTHLVYHKGKHVFKAMKDFIDQVLQEAKEWK